MLIDWFTVIAQILNFLVLVVLLKHFLYGPILPKLLVTRKNLTDKRPSYSAMQYTLDPSFRKDEPESDDWFAISPMNYSVTI